MRAATSTLITTEKTEAKKVEADVQPGNKKQAFYAWRRNVLEVRNMAGISSQFVLIIVIILKSFWT